MASQIDNTNLSQWALLPNDLLHEITQRLHKHSDYVRFGVVCKRWLSFAHRNFRQKHLLHIYQNLPLLLIPTESHLERFPTERHLERCGLYSITEDMVYDQFQLYLPYKRCCGSSYGWLFFVEKVNESTLELILLNPFLGDSATIKLPPIKFCPEDEVHMVDHIGIQKAILSKDPYVSPDDYEVVVLYGTFAKLAHYKSGDKFWSYAIKTERLVLVDVIFHSGLIFAVDRHGWIVNFTLEPIMWNIDMRRNLVCGIQSTSCSPWYLEWNKLSILPRDGRLYAGIAYLVKNSKGDLLLVRSYYWDEDEREARGEAAERGGGNQEVEFDQSKFDEEQCAEPNLIMNFRVYRLCFPSYGEQLRVNKLRMKTLHGETLFLGYNNTISVSASKYPGLRPNSIYYIDNYYTHLYPRNLLFGSCDMGIFNVENGSFGKFVPSFLTKGMPPPTFVVPQPPVEI